MIIFLNEVEAPEIVCESFSFFFFSTYTFIKAARVKFNLLKSSKVDINKNEKKKVNKI